MADESDNWIKTPAFNWTPETPLRLEPQFTAKSEFAAAKAETAEPRAEAIITPAPVAEKPKPRFTPAAAAQKPRPRTAPQPVKEAAARPAPFQVPTLSLFQARMATGLAQGTLLFALFALRDVLNPYVFSAALMLALFAPLLLLAGLGRVRQDALLIWAGFASVLLAAAGAYHHWRTLSSDSGHPGLALLALVILFLFAGQSLAEAGGQDYPAHYRSSWRLAIRIVLCALFAGLAWAAAGAVSGFLRQHYPALQTQPLTMPLVALSAALAAQLTGARLLGALQEGLVFVFTLALPVALLLAITVVAASAFGYWQPSLAVPTMLGLVLIIGINASYRDGTSWRPYWRRRLEFAGSLVLIPLLILAASILAARTEQFGWTANRIFALAGLLLLAGYAICYVAAALISLGGGGWMQRIEAANLAMAFAALGLIAALASPVADPARLAVAAQSFRLEQHRVTPEAFDYSWLREDGLRFGHQALMEMAANTSAPAVARGAFGALGVAVDKVGSERPAPTEIGANIHVHSGGGLPAGLLARDWSGVTGAPPCLTSAALGCDAFFADLDGDGNNEILLAYGSDARWWASVMKQGVGGGWYVAGTLAAPPCPGGLAALRAGRFAAVRPAGNWRDLVVDGIRLSVTPAIPGLSAIPVACPAA